MSIGENCAGGLPVQDSTVQALPLGAIAKSILSRVNQVDVWRQSG
jgi:hypothetical protein